MKVIITKNISESWATREELIAMSDEDIVGVLQEDVIELLDGALWIIQREPVSEEEMESGISGRD